MAATVLVVVAAAPFVAPQAASAVTPPILSHSETLLVIGRGNDALAGMHVGTWPGGSGGIVWDPMANDLCNINYGFPRQCHGDQWFATLHSGTAGDGVAVKIQADAAFSNNSPTDPTKPFVVTPLGPDSWMFSYHGPDTIDYGWADWNQVMIVTPVGSGLANQLLHGVREGGGTGLTGPAGKAVCWCSTGFPVDTLTGNFWHTFNDVSIPGRGTGLGFSRTYNSNVASAQKAGSVTPGLLGYGWSSSWTQSLTIDSTSSPRNVTFNDASGASADVGTGTGTAASFTSSNGTSWTPGNYVQGSLSVTGSGSSAVWTMIEDHSTTYKFCSTGHLQSITDPNGYVTTVTYGSGTAACTGTAPQMTGVTESTDVSGTAGRSLAFGYDASGYLHTVTDPLGRVWTYNVDSTAKTLTSAVDPMGRTWKFTYDTSAQMLTMQDPVAAAANPSSPTTAALTNQYTSGQVTAQWTPAAEAAHGGNADYATQFVYNANPVSGDPSTRTEVVEPLATTTATSHNMTTYTFVGGVMTAKLAGQTIDSLSAGNISVASAGLWTYGYDSTTGGVTSVTDPNGNTTTTTYCTSNTSTCAAGHVQNTYNDSNSSWTVGGVTHTGTYYVYDDCSGTSPTCTGLPTDVYDPTGIRTTYTYNNHINVATKTITPNTGSGTRTTTFNHTDSSHPEDVTSVQDPNGNTTSYSYNSYGQPVSATGPASVSANTTYRYDLDGESLATVAPNGNASGGTPDANRTVRVLNDDGEPTVSLDPAGAPVGDGFNRVDHTTSLDNADSGQAWTVLTSGTAFATAIRQAKLHTTATSGPNVVVTASAAQGPDGTAGVTLAAVQSGTGEGLVFRASNSSNYWKVVANGSHYDLIKVVAGTPTTVSAGFGTCACAGDRITVRYNAGSIKVYINGTQQTSVTDTALDTNTQAGLYLPAGDTTGALDDFYLTGSNAVTGSTGGAVVSAYDANGNTLWSLDGDGNLTSTTYDADNEPLVTTQANSTTTTTSWDFNHEKTGYTDANSHTSTYGYDAAHRIIADTPAGMCATTYSYTYNATSHQETDVTTQPGSGTACAGGGTITNTLDRANRLASTTYASGTSSDLFTETDTVTVTATGGTFTLSSTVPSHTGTTTAIAYNATAATVQTALLAVLGTDNVSVNGPAGGPYAVSYQGALIAQNLSGDLTANGTNLTGTGHSISATSQINGAANVTYAYNNDNQRVAMDTANLAATSGCATPTGWSRHPSSCWTYTGYGELATSTRGNPNPGLPLTTAYTYDANSNECLLTFQYNQTDPAPGPGTNCSSPSAYGHTVTMTYDAYNQMHTEQDWVNTTPITYTWDPSGNLTNISYPNGDTAVRTPDADGRYPSIAYNQGATNLKTYQVTYDQAGLNTQEVSASGSAQTTTYTYDALNRVTNVSSNGAITGGVTVNPNVGYDNGNNLTTQAQINQSTHTTTSRTQAFNTADQLCWTITGTSSNTCTSPPTGATTYAYDPTGNQTTGYINAIGSLTNNYNQNHEMVQSIGNSITTTYMYDGDGARLSKTFGSGSSNTDTYSWDESSGLPRMLTDYGPATNNWVYDPLGQPIERIRGTTTSTINTLHQDQLGSTRMLTLNTGAAGGTFANDTYGREFYKGFYDTELKFAGQYLDTQTGYYYMRSRYYDPTTGQFLSRDSLSSAGGNAYAYVGGNPVTRADPAGKCWNPLKAECWEPWRNPPSNPVTDFIDNVKNWIRVNATADAAMNACGTDASCRWHVAVSNVTNASNLILVACVAGSMATDGAAAETICTVSDAAGKITNLVVAANAVNSCAKSVTSECKASIADVLLAQAGDHVHSPGAQIMIAVTPNPLAVDDEGGGEGDRRTGRGPC